MEWVPIFSVGGVWASAIGGLFVYLHGRSTAARTELEERLGAQIAALATQTKNEHQAVNAQVYDLARSVSDNYVRRTEFEPAIRGFHDVVAEARKEIGAVHNRVDELFKSVAFRRGVGS